MNAPQSAREWLESAHVTDTLARHRAEELVRPVPDRLMDALQDAPKESVCIEWGEGERHRAVYWDDLTENFRAVRGPDHNAYQARNTKSFDDLEGAFRWALAR